MSEQEHDKAAERERDPDLSRRYRGLEREEPPPALDATIRAEARRALATHVAPLVPPTGRRRWYFPVAAAAVIVLAVAVTSQVEREQPAAVSETDLRAQTAPAAPEARRAPEAKPRQAEPAESTGRMRDQIARRRDTPARAAPAEKPAASQIEKRDSRSQFTPPPEAQTGARATDQQADSATALGGAASSNAYIFPQNKGPAAAREMQTPKVEEQAQSAPQSSADSRLHKSELYRQGAPAAQAPAPSPAMPELGRDEAPAPWLERIAQLRSQGKAEEADKELERFRKRYPAYQIPPEMLRRIEKK